jgi:hypothetical protein
VWPNVSREELVSLCGRLAGGEHDVIVVFDGLPAAVEAPPGVLLLGEPGRSADDVIVELAALPSSSVSVVATSDRELRSRLRAHGVHAIGAGGLVRDLLAGRAPTG